MCTSTSRPSAAAEIERELLHICQGQLGSKNVHNATNLVRLIASTSKGMVLLEAIHQQYPWLRVSWRDLKENATIAQLAHFLAKKAGNQKASGPEPDIRREVLHAPDSDKHKVIEEYIWERIAHARAMHPKDVQQIALLRGRLSLDLVRQDLLWDFQRDFRLTIQKDLLHQSCTMDELSPYVASQLCS